MKDLFAIEPTQFITATIYQWNLLLENDKHKGIIIESLQSLVSKKRIEVNAFFLWKIIYIIVWQALTGFSTSANQASFMKYTARQLKLSLVHNDEKGLSLFKVNKCDRDYQVWKREPLSVDLLNESMFIQKLEYIHYNPITAGLCKMPEDYFYSPARFYHDGSNSFNMLTHYSGN
jgi:REP-associated tyrosine transposase